MLALQALTPEALIEALPQVTLPEARKIVSAVHRGTSIAGPIHQVRTVSMQAVRAAGHVPALTVREQVASALDPFIKLALATHDAQVIETVRIPLERAGRFTVCVSSQAGCALGCTFCATGTLGLIRNLEAWEMVEQVRLVRAGLPADGKIHGVVFQGMGEPLSNIDRVLATIAVLSESSAQAVDARNITVSTAGLPTGIRRLAREAPKVRLALSVHSAKPDVRRRLMPIARAHDLEDVLDASIEHAQLTGLAPLWSVTLLAGVNDSDDDAHAIAALAQRFAVGAGLKPRISVIPYNAIGELGAEPYGRASLERDHAFRTVLKGHELRVHRRYSGGSDVGAACGQLAGRPNAGPTMPAPEAT